MALKKFNNFVSKTFLLLCICIQFNVSIQNEDLRKLIIIHRNGDRTPTETYPNDALNVHKFWFEGAGQLTERGKERMYRLGQFIARRYKNFITEQPSEVYSRSSAMERCLESAQLVLAGMYPPQGKWIWNENLMWQPIAVKTTDLETDSMLNPNAECMNAEEELKRIHSMNEYLDLKDKFQGLMANLTEFTGMKVENLETVAMLQDILEIQQKKGWKLADWVTDSFLKQMKTISDKSLTFDVSTKLMQKLKVGVLMGKIKEILEKSENDHDENDVNKASLQKVFLFTTHAKIIAAILSALDVFNYIKPPFGATIFIEFSSANKIRLLYMNATEFETPITLPLHDCDYEDECDLNKFLKTLDRVASQNWKRECGYFNADKCHDSGYQTYATVVIVLGLIAIVAALFVFVREKQRRSNIEE